MRLGRLACSALVAFAVAGCAARDPIVSPSVGVAPSGNWKIEQQTDRISGAPISSAYVSTKNASHSGQAFKQPAMMNLACFRGEPVVRIAFTFKVGANRNTSLAYRFDDKPGREIDARFLNDYSTVVIEDQGEVFQFIEDMKGSRSLYLLVRSLNAGRSSAEFEVDGASAAIDSAFASCPPKRPEPEPVKKKRQRRR